MNQIETATAGFPAEELALARPAERDFHARIRTTLPGWLMGQKHWHQILIRPLPDEPGLSFDLQLEGQ